MKEQNKTSSESEAPVNPVQEIRREVIELAKMVLLFLVLFWGLKTFVIEGYEVLGDSMLPTYQEGDRIIVFKLPHEISNWRVFSWMEPIDPGDVIVFDSQDAANKRYIKRVIARGPNQPEGNTVEAEQHDSEDDWFVHVIYDKGDVYVDNQPVDEDEYLPPVEKLSADRDECYLKANQYYVLGDHRSVSKDSRSFGPVDDKQIIGTALIRFWPLSRFGLL